jgi:Domain of unknown function (DUF397)
MTAPEPDTTVWRTSSYSPKGSACVQVASTPERILVRDSKDPDGPALAVPALAVPTRAWHTFLTAATP